MDEFLIGKSQLFQDNRRNSDGCDDKTEDDEVAEDCLVGLGLLLLRVNLRWCGSSKTNHF